MPYIKEDQRKWLDYHHGANLPKDPGELNYLISTLCRDYFNRNKRYQTINDIIGALEGAKLEFYRRVAASYEDTKIAENGDVY